jgi:hypothetical protein
MTTIQSQSQVRAEDTTQSLSQNPVQNLNRDLGQDRDQDTNQDPGQSQDQDRSQDLDQDQGLGNAVEIHHLTCTTGRIQIISEGSTIQRTKLTTIGVTSPSITIIDMSIGQLGHLQDQDNFEEKVLLQVLKNWITNA